MRLVVTLFVCLLIAPKPARAETQPWLGVLTSGGILGAATTLGGVTTYIGLSVNIPRKEKVLQRYLDENEPAVRQAMVLGDSDLLADLAMILNVENKYVAELSKLLRTRRTDLLDAAYVKQDVALWFEVAAEASRRT